MTASRRTTRLRLAAALPPIVIGALVSLPTPAANAAPSTTIVINEVYGGGGNSGAPYSNDFVELRNIGTTTVDVSGWSVQYASSAGTSYQVTALGGKVPAGGVYLVQQAAGANAATPLPTPDATGTTNMSATSGKVALVDNATALGCGADCDAAAGVVDFVGFGSANDFEGQVAPAPSNTTSITRAASGADTDVNGADFSAGAPTPQNCSSTNTCTQAVTSSIAEIQGAGHLSPLAGDAVSDVTGIVTARKSNGFWMQDPRGTSAPGYVDGASSGIFVFTGGTPAADLTPGTSLSLDAKVSEFRPGSAGLTITELTQPVVTVVDTGTALPAATVVGPGGLVPPADVIDNDAAGGPAVNVETQGDFEPAEDGIDFWESLEGMRLELDDARVVGPTNTRFGETAIVPAGSGTQTARGGIVLQQDDPNPERIVLDSGLGTLIPSADTGDTYAGATEGILDYEFNNFHLLATTTPTLAAGGIQRETTAVAAQDELSVGTFNVENLDPTDPQSKFDQLAEMIVTNLRSPDLLALEEVQDNNGATDDGTVAADVTLQKLVDAIEAAGGPSYSWQQINPVNDAEGGEPGGNIRVAFLVQQGTPLRFVTRDPGDSTTDTDVATVDGQAALTHSPGRVDPTNPAFDDSRVPLAGEFTFGGQKVFVVANHWSSKGGDDPLMGPEQPPFQSSEAKRQHQAQAVTDFVDEIFSVDPSANVVVLGDLNDFEYSESVMTLREGASQPMLDLPATLPVDDRYTYVFEGNSQVLDHIVISPGLANQGYSYDVVHANSEFHDQISDHDPQGVNLELGLNAVSVTAAATPSQLVYGQDSTVSGSLLDEDTGDGVAGAEVGLESRDSGSSDWQPTGSPVTTGADGSYSFTVTPDRNTDYRVVFAGDATNSSAQSGVAHVDVAPRVTINVSDETVRKRQTVLFTGVVAPDHAGDSVDLQRLVRGDWQSVDSARLDQDSIYSFRWTPGNKEKKGDSTWRVVKPADSDHVQGMSAEVVVTVR